MAKKEDKQEREIFAWMASFLTIIGFLIAYLTKRDDKYIMYYAKHGMVLFIFFLIAGILTWIPIIGWIIYLSVIVLWVITWVNSLSGKKKETILVTELAKRIELK